MGSSSKYVPTVTNRMCMEFAKLCGTAESLEIVAAAADKLSRKIRGRASKKGTWKYYFRRFAAALRSGKIPSSIFKMDGNQKLPFVAFSTLPIITCPGAGACAGFGNLKKAWCYSLRAWRYPAAFLRQCSNTLLLRFNRRAIIDAFRALPTGITLRLYVDGDFGDMSTLVFWMNLLRQRPDVQAYGYSKSWELLLQFPGEFPPNYVLNISSGSKYDGDHEIRARMLALPITRGEFIAVKLSRRHAKGAKKYDSPDYHRDVRESAAAAGIGKVFSCPGVCDKCIGPGHACGLVQIDSAGARKFTLPLPIAIGIH